MSRSWRTPAVTFACAALVLGVAGCSSATLRPELASHAASALELSDALEDLIAEGKATEEDRDAAYELVKMLPGDTAGDAFGHAAIAGRVAEVKGAGSLFSVDHNPTSLVGEAERWATLSRQKDSTFRDGAATRMLGTLYVLAPADMLKHGDSEEGVSMLEKLVEQNPDLPVNQLRLAEAYIALQDKKAAEAPLCIAVDHRAALRRDDQGLLDKLLVDIKPFECPKK
jgi:hypothetical protein